MKSLIIASALALSLLVGSLAFAQSDEQLPPDGVADDPALSMDAPTETPSPTAVASPTAVPKPFIQATVLKTDRMACTAGIEVPNKNGCDVILLPDPAHPLPGLSQYDWSPGAIGQIPSPVGAPLFTRYFRPISGVDYVEFMLAPRGYATYAYTCQTGQCTGSAEDVWHAAPAAQKEPYFVAVLQAERDNQSWGPQLFEVTVITGDQRPGEDPGRGCAMMQASDLVVKFATSCSGPFQDHLAQ